MLEGNHLETSKRPVLLGVKVNWFDQVITSYVFHTNLHELQRLFITLSIKRTFLHGIFLGPRTTLSQIYHHCTCEDKVTQDLRKALGYWV